MSSSTEGKERGELFGGLFGLILTGCLWGILYYEYRHDIAVMASSHDMEVMVIGKKRGAVKNDPRTVYIRDGAAPIGVVTSGRWYFETVIGQKTIVKYSPRYHEYRQPYHRTGRGKFMLWYIGALHMAMTARVIWLIRYLWFNKSKSGSAEAEPDHSASL